MRRIGKARPVLLSALMAMALFIQGRDLTAQNTETLTVAGGCFWCVEADFESVPGVLDAVSGYTGGTTKNPTYKQVTRGGSGHFEAVLITFDPSLVSREALLHMFLRSIDPTDAEGQFCDRGESYRSAIFVSNSDEKALAVAALARAGTDLGQEIVTPVLPAAVFYEAEAYHQDYYKGSKLIFTRGGPKKQSQAYAFYRKGCGRDARVLQLWGSAAPFAKAS